MKKDQAAHTSVKTYLLAFAVLAALTGATVVLSYMDLPHNVAIVLAVLIALTKCTLIMVFFMHFRSESKGVYAVFFTALFLVIFLGVYLLPDIAFTK